MPTIEKPYFCFNAWVITNMALMKDKKIVVSVMQYMSEVTNPIRVCCSNKRAVKFSQNSKYKEHKTLQNPNCKIKEPIDTCSFFVLKL